MNYIKDMFAKTFETEEELYKYIPINVLQHTFLLCVESYLLHNITKIYMKENVFKLNLKLLILPINLESFIFIEN